MTKSTKVAIAKIQRFQTNFTSGELSPRLAARSDLVQYQNGVKSMINAYPLIHGCAKRRPGTKFIGEVLDSTRIVKEIPFIFSNAEAFVLIFNGGYIQIIKDDEFILPTGSPTQITAPIIGHPSVSPTREQIYHSYLDSELPQIDYSQQGSELILCHNKHAPATLSYDGVNWTLNDMLFTYHALSDNAYKTSYLNFQIVTGTTKFDTTSEFTLVTDGAGNITTGPTLTGTGNGVLTAISIAKAFDVANTTWTIKCVYSILNRQEWTVTSSNGITPITKWSPNNYPRGISFYEQRLWFGGTLTDPQMLWGTKIGNYNILTLGSNDNDGCEFQISSGRYDEILHLESSRQLLPLTYGSEFSVQGTYAQGITPSSVRIQPQTTYGSSVVSPMRIGSEILFLQGDGKKVRSISFDAPSDSNIAVDLTLLAEHITHDGIVDMTFSQSPDYISWFVTKSGDILSLTLLRSESITAWAQHTSLGGFENVTSIPYLDTTRTYLVATHIINGVYKRYIERFDYETKINNISGATTDCSLTLNDSQSTTIYNLDYLEGETVDIVADGLVLPQQTVINGTVAMPYPVAQVHVGLHFDTTITFLNPEPLGNSSTRADKFSIYEIVLILHNTIGSTLEFTDGNGKIVKDQVIPFFKVGDFFDTAPSLFTGNKTINTNGWSDKYFLTIKQTLPQPFEILGAIFKMSINSK